MDDLHNINDHLNMSEYMGYQDDGYGNAYPTYPTQYYHGTPYAQYLSTDDIKYSRFSNDITINSHYNAHSDGESKGDDRRQHHHSYQQTIKGLNPILPRRTNSFEAINSFENKRKKRKKILTTSKVTGIDRLEIRHDPPVVGCKLIPMVYLKYDNGMVMPTTECQYTWYKSVKRVCCVCDKPARIECFVCIKLGIKHNDKSYFCSSTCMIKDWQNHTQKIHSKKSDIKFDTNMWIDDDIDIKYRIKNTHKTINDDSIENKYKNLFCKFPPPILNKWETISHKSVYEPTNNDIGCMILCEAKPLINSDNIKITNNKNNNNNSNTNNNDNKNDDDNSSIAWIYKELNPVLGRPEISPERPLIYNIDKSFYNDIKHGTFKVLSYNCLAPIYTNTNMYPYVKPHVLNWDYRKYNIKREILRHDPDIICLQEIQYNHFEEYFTKELKSQGYEGIFRQKSRETSKKYEVDGCAIFFKKKRYQIANRFHIDFNDTSSLYLRHHQKKYNEACILKGKPKLSQTTLKKMIKRLTKGNIALILVLEEVSSEMAHIQPKRICIANTHVYWDPQFTDVKLWQSWILCQEISKLVLQRHLPLILCGDFNSVPSSAVYKLLTSKSIDKKMHEELVAKYGQLCIIPTIQELNHNLSLKSSYKIEPTFTNYTQQYKGTLDYILYSNSSLKCCGYLKEPNETELSKEIALPNSKHSSDHVPLMSIFTFKDEYDKRYEYLKTKQQMLSLTHQNNNNNNNQLNNYSINQNISNNNNNTINNNRLRNKNNNRLRRSLNVNQNNALSTTSSSDKSSTQRTSNRNYNPHRQRRSDIHSRRRNNIHR